MDWDTNYFHDKTAVVTGAASGVGLALCELLLEYGAGKVTLADYNRENLDRETARLSATFPDRVAGVLCNVTIKEEVFALIRQAANFGGGRLDILINCAGAGLQGKFLFEPDGVVPGNPALAKVLTNEDWQKGFALNFAGPVYGCEAAVPIMIGQGGGQIVNIASGIALAPMAYQSLYAATKAALVAFSYSIRSELHAYGVRVNAATPGTTATAIFRKAGVEAPPDAQSPRASAEKILRGAAENRRLTLGDKDDEAAAVSGFLPDDMGRYLDQLFGSVAKMRRSGRLAFTTETQRGESTPLFTQARAIAQMLAGGDLSQLEALKARFAQYIAMRDATGLDASYYAGKTAAVTGGASGVGFALCKKLLECGAEKVVLSDYHAENLEKRAAELNALFPGNAKGVWCDVADERNVQSMIAQATDWFESRFDILINCAGISQMGMTFAVPDAANVRMPMETPETWKRLFDVDFAGALYGCRAVLPIMLKQGGGQIVNIISGMALMPMPYSAIYSSVKAALNMTTLSLRYEFAEDGIKINAASPGLTATGIFGKSDIPTSAQSPETAAIRILTGVARNDRLIPGDDGDLSSMFHAHNPGAAPFIDGMLNGLAASRKDGGTYEFFEKATT